MRRTWPESLRLSARQAAEPQPTWMGSRRRFWPAPTTLTLTEPRTPYSLYLTNSLQSATVLAYGKAWNIFREKGPWVGWPHPGDHKSVPAWETGFMQAFTVDCLLSRRGGSAALQGPNC
jgi:hypothetical protein